MKNNFRIEDDKCYIELTQGKECVIDLENMELVSQYKWCAHKDKNTYYVVTNIRKNKKQHHLKLHRLLLYLSPGDKKQVDHKDGNGLNNCRKNLRICTNRENQWNQKSKIGSSKFKGLSWFKRDKKWEVRITQNRKTIRLGYFTNEIEAAKAYDAKALELFGEFANLNFPEEMK